MSFFMNRPAYIVLVLLSVSMSCGSIAFVAQAARGDESGLRDIPQAFASLEYLVGRWKGQGRPKERSAQQFRGWSESHVWAWVFEKGKPVGLTVTIEGGKILATGRLRYDAERKRYRLDGTEPKPAGGPIAFEGTLGRTGKQLVLDRVGPEGKLGKVRLTLWPNANFIRYTMTQDHQEPGAVRFSPAIEVGLTKEGESLTGGGTAWERPKCIVTGGAANFALTYEGKTYPVCCTGCRDEFDANPEKYIKKASLILRSQAGNAKSNQPAPSRVSRFEDAFAGDVPTPTGPGRTADQGNPTTPDSKEKLEKAESSSSSGPTPVQTKAKTPSKPDNAKTTTVTKTANRAATLLRIAQNLEKDGKTDAALKNFRQIVKDFAGTPAAKTAAERIKALDGW
jgi:YHS domain-containing protein